MMAHSWNSIEGAVSFNEIFVVQCTTVLCALRSHNLFSFLFCFFKMRYRAKESGPTTSVCLFQNLLVKKQFQCFLTLLVATGRYSGAVFDIFLWGARKKRVKPKKASFVRLGIVVGLGCCRVIAIMWNTKDRTKGLSCFMNALDYCSATTGTRLAVQTKLKTVEDKEVQRTAYFSWSCRRCCWCYCFSHGWKLVYLSAFW